MTIEKIDGNQILMFNHAKTRIENTRTFKIKNSGNMAAPFQLDCNEVLDLDRT